MPVYAMAVVATVIVTFTLCGNINTLAPIVTMPFLMMYATIDYAYFALAQTFDIQHQRELRFRLVNYIHTVKALLTLCLAINSSPIKFCCFEMMVKRCPVNNGLVIHYKYLIIWHVMIELNKYINMGILINKFTP